MRLAIRDAHNSYDVKIQINDLINVKGAIFKVNSVSLNPKQITLQPANPDQTRRYIESENVLKPELSKDFEEEEAQEEKESEETGDGN